MATQRPYQGYPYTNPHVTDAPTIDAATASRWADLPRRPLQARNVFVKTEGQNSDPDSRPRQNKEELDSNPVIYVDVPEGSSSDVAEPVGTEPEYVQSTRPRRVKEDLAGSPVIYIDVPESSGSAVAQRVAPEEPAYVQETIFYNPFDNRRIDQGKDGESTRSSDSEGSYRPPVRTRPTPPSTLNLSSPGSSGYGSNYTTPGLPPSMSKEAYMYQSNGFPPSPIPVSEFPQPPPAYTEIETPVGTVGTVGTVGGCPVGAESPRSPVPSEPLRTVVITAGSDHRQRFDEPSPIGLPNPFRKVVYCQHCGHKVHTLVIRQTGAATHVVALSFLCIGLFPMTILVYLTDTCKNKNHYCPNCNKKIGYEVPVLCKNFTYTK